MSDLSDVPETDLVKDIKSIYNKTLLCPEQEDIVKRTIQVLTENHYSLSEPSISLFIQEQKDAGTADDDISDTLALRLLYHLYTKTPINVLVGITSYNFRPMVIGVMDWTRERYARLRNEEIKKLIDQQSQAEPFCITADEIESEQSPVYTVEIDFDEGSREWNRNKKRSLSSGLYYYTKKAKK